MTTGFAGLKVCSETVGLLKKAGIVKPMPVQEQVIPALFAGKDVIVRAQTGTGKTLAFLVPLMEKIKSEKKFVQALIIVPTRELATQITTEAKKLIGTKEIKVLSVSGGRDFEQQKSKLQGVTHMMVGTPGRLLDHIRKGNTNLGGVSYLILDEVDEMLEQGFIDEAAELIAMTSPERQTVLCSATLSEEVRKLGKRLTRNCALIDINPEKATVDAIKQICIKTTDDFKERALESLISRFNPYLMLIFCFSKERAIALSDSLATKQYNVDVLYGEMSQAKRKTVMKAFRDAKLQILVATDLAARGLDIEGVTHVINYDIPHDVDWYVHRIGRTGRAGRDGIAVTLYTADEVRWLKQLEDKLKIKMERQNLQGETIARRTSAGRTEIKRQTRKTGAASEKPAEKKLGSKTTGANKRKTTGTATEKPADKKQGNKTGGTNKKMTSAASGKPFEKKQVGKVSGTNKRKAVGRNEKAKSRKSK